MTQVENSRLARRELLRRGALVGGAVLWTAPVVQSIGGTALAVTGSECGCMTGGSSKLPGTYDGDPGEVTIGLGKICCGSSKATIEVNFHPTGANKKADHSWHFTQIVTMTCTNNGNPAPPKNTAESANHFVGTATDGSSILSFDLNDFGEGGAKPDLATISIKASGGITPILTASGSVGGNLQAHKGKC